MIVSSFNSLGPSASPNDRVEVGRLSELGDGDTDVMQSSSSHHDGDANKTKKERAAYYVPS